MLKRRDILKAAGVAAAAAFASRHPLIAQTAINADPLHFTSDSMEAQLSAEAPELLLFNVDGLGKAKRGANIVSADHRGSGYSASTSFSNGGHRVEYRANGAGKESLPVWTFEFSGSKIVLTSQWSAEFDPPPFSFRFELNQVPSTVLGLFRENNLMASPVLMHFPGQGSVRITSSVQGRNLSYQSDKSDETAMLALPPATFEHKRVVYALDVTSIYPELPGISGDERFDAFRRNWLDGLQLNPSLEGLSNNTASDTCAFCYYEYSDIAALTPPLAEGLTALDIMRQTLDRILAGASAYGLPVLHNHPCSTSDTHPSMVIAAANCVRKDRNNAWLAANYEGIRGWIESILGTDSDHNGLSKYCISGNSGIWGDGNPRIRPSNWWDTIGFGYEDAYGNALAYRALRDMAMMSKRLGKAADATRYSEAADKLRSVYFERFYDPQTGVLGGWRSADGQLHDYYFLWLNGIAIHYGLVPKPQANDIMDKLLAKMKEVGYDKFNLGLPGNLITIPLKDYVHRDPGALYGGGLLPDNSDGFQKYENGGATGSFAFFTLAALYDLGRKADADRILFPMLDEYGRYGFSGRDEKGRSYDWRKWDGTAGGYEGMLTDNYYALLAVPLRQSGTQWQSGFRPETSLS